MFDLPPPSPAAKCITPPIPSLPPGISSWSATRSEASDADEEPPREDPITAYLRLVRTDTRVWPTSHLEACLLYWALVSDGSLPDYRWFPDLVSYVSYHDARQGAIAYELPVGDGDDAHAGLLS